MSVVSESTIRKMTRLAQDYQAVNLSQGFPNEAPPVEVRLALAHAVLAGQPAEANEILTMTSKTASSSSRIGSPTEEVPENDIHLRALMRKLSSMSSSSSSMHNDRVDDYGSTSSIAPISSSKNADVLNQYSPPMGREDVRSAIATYYQRFYNYNVEIDNITVTLGATEALASAIRSLGQPGDTAVIFEPFHELYPSQCHLFYLKPVFVTLRPTTTDKKRWTFDRNELEEALRGARILILNSPHNPTGKIFSMEELQFIVDLCLKYRVYIVTDEIYEFMCYSEENDHILIPKAFPDIANLCLVCNSIGKSASATGWRLGWCIHPVHISSTYRGIHDQLAVMSPHPMQYATLTYLALPDAYFRTELKQRYKERIDVLSATLTTLGFDVIDPEGAYYLFVKYRGVPALTSIGSPYEAAMYLLHKVGVACVPGDNFYGKAIKEEGQQYLRFAACRSIEDIREACSRLRKHLGVPLATS